MPISLSTPLLSTDTALLPGAGASKSEKIHKAAQQFESLLIGEMLKTAHASGDGGWLGSGDSPGSDSALQMAESQLAEALSSGKGLGLASVIERALSQQTSQKVAEIPPANSGVSLKKP